MAIYPVILAGGRGTRLWPLSRGDKPKQFLPISGEHSLFQQTILRNKELGLSQPWVVCGERDRFQVLDGIAAIGVLDATVVLEPLSRNTAPAIASAAVAILKKDPDAVLFVQPSDHLIVPDECYSAMLDAAFAAARAGRMVTFGIVPTYPETGYGYIKAAAASGAGPLVVERFVEKPPAAEAAQMVAEGSFYWNAGFFAFSAKAFLDELAKTDPEVFAAAEKAVTSASDDGAGEILLGAEAYADAPEISIDYALFERTDKASVAPVTSRWSDVGSWSAYWDTLEKDEGGNAVRGRGHIVDSSNSLIVSDRLDVVALGLDRTAIVVAEDSVLVCPLDRSQDVKKVVATLRESKREDLLDSAPTVIRPWGGYTSILNGERFQVKRLFVTPGKKLSLQKHHHRAEHWVVVRGTAEVTIDENVVTLSENQSTYIPLGAVHRLANPGRIMLEVIEVQSGSYLGEDDIVRLQDVWGRT